MSSVELGTPCVVKEESQQQMFPSTPAVATPKLNLTTTPEQPYEVQNTASWDQIIDRLVHIIPEDTFIAIRQTIQEALSAAEAQGGAAHAIVAGCLRFALSKDGTLMRTLALRTLEKCRPKRIDPVDDVLRRFLSLQPAGATPLVPSIPVNAESDQTRAPSTVCAPSVSGRSEARFREDVEKQRSKPWHELIEEIRSMKPNNGHPVRVNITAAMKSAAQHRVYRSHDIVKRLAHALTFYSRKSCGITKQEAIKALQIFYYGREGSKP